MNETSVFIGPACHSKRHNATKKKLFMSVVEIYGVASDHKPSTNGPGKYAEHMLIQLASPLVLKPKFHNTATIKSYKCILP
jgi:hypothetical protein